MFEKLNNKTDITKEKLGKSIQIISIYQGKTWLNESRRNWNTEGSKKANDVEREGCWVQQAVSYKSLALICCGHEGGVSTGRQHHNSAGQDWSADFQQPYFTTEHSYILSDCHLTIKWMLNPLLRTFCFVFWYYTVKTLILNMNSCHSEWNIKMYFIFNCIKKCSFMNKYRFRNLTSF